MINKSSRRHRVISNECIMSVSGKHALHLFLDIVSHLDALPLVIFTHHRNRYLNRLQMISIVKWTGGKRTHTPKITHFSVWIGIRAMEICISKHWHITREISHFDQRHTIYAMNWERDTVGRLHTYIVIILAECWFTFVPYAIYNNSNFWRRFLCN